MEPKAKVKLENELADEIEIGQVVRQGCILSPFLFNVSSETILKDAITEQTTSIIFNEETANIVRYTDDIIILLYEKCV